MQTFKMRMVKRPVQDIFVIPTRAESEWKLAVAKLRFHQEKLARVRQAGDKIWERLFSRHVLAALDRLWEAQEMMKFERRIT